ncbi:hypothetical protein EGH24_10555 [Halonotius terrestris]|uniref:Uncharacterized protein n=1 Tax=Halonotius terrestris TaxID=2487750 RepID=A0A8J8P8J1_9EURY|nr:hypothetical protein [Halonotius terrestris]TQQ79914.1 hypothetical protein EGH24_10555 [Halonotius terrestris]
MEYERTTDDEELTEWERADGNATIRLRERADGQFAVRYDQLHQAEGGRAYAYETVESREAAEELVAAWQADAPA